MNISFWQNMPSPHQSAFLRALAALGHEVSLLVDQEELPERRAMGWTPPDLGDVKVTVRPSDAAVAALIDRGVAGGACHIISGMRGAQLSARVFALCRSRGARVGLLAEPGDPRGLKGVLRRGVYTWDALRWRHATDLVLAMGQTGVDWYVTAGYPPEKVFPFGYVVEAPAVAQLSESRPQGVRIVFVGSLIQLKGVDLLLRALAHFQTSASGWQLDIIGDGPDRPALQRLADVSGIGGRVRFLGMLPMAAVAHDLPRADLLVLPSYYDGWGAVVSEALMCGTPVVCSDRCGAADLIRAPWLGAVFRAGSVNALRQALAERIAQGPVTPQMRARIRTWAGCITGEAMARYFLAVLEHVYGHAPRPQAPWRLPVDGAMPYSGTAGKSTL